MPRTREFPKHTYEVHAADYVSFEPFVFIHVNDLKSANQKFENTRKDSPCNLVEQERNTPCKIRPPSLEKSPSHEPHICGHKSFQNLASAKHAIPKYEKTQHAHCGHEVPKSICHGRYLLVGVARWESRHRRNVCVLVLNVQEGL